MVGHEKKDGKKLPRILHLGKYDLYSNEAGGIERVIQDIADDHAHQFRIGLIAFSPDVTSVIRISETIERYLIPIHMTSGHAPVNILLSIYLKKIIKKFSPDIIHIHMPGLMPFFCLPQLKNYNTVTHWHADIDGTAVSKIILFPVYKFLEQKVLQYTDQIIATSPHYFHSSRPLKQFKNKCTIIPLGTQIDTNLPEMDLPKSIQTFIKGKQVILSVGRLAYYKGYRYLIEAINHIGDDNVVLIIAGEGPEKNDLDNYVRRLNLNHRIMLTGHITDRVKCTLFHQADVFCLPSIDRAEAFGVSIIEAMAFGCPVITTHVSGSGMNYVNNHMKTGLKVPPQNSASLANAIQYLLQHPDLAKKLGQNARKKYEGKFKSSVCTEKIGNLYRPFLKS